MRLTYYSSLSLENYIIKLLSCKEIKIIQPKI